MSKSFYLIVALILFSCNRDENKTSIEKDSIHKSALTYYADSKLSSNSLSKRIHAINKAFRLSSKTDTLYTRILYQKNSLHFSAEQYDSLLFYGDILIATATLNKDNWSIGRQYHLLGYYFQTVEKSRDSAFYNYNLSRGNFLKDKDSSNVGKRLLDMSIIQKNQNDFFGSKETITEALQFLNPKKDQKYIASSFNILATNHRKLLNFSDAITYYNQAIERTPSEKDKLIYQNNLAVTYVDNQEYALAISLLKLISKDTLLGSNQRTYARVQDNLTYAKWLSGAAVNENEFQEPLKIRIENKDQRGQIASYTHLGEFYSKTDSKKAEPYFDSVIHLSKTIKIPRAEKDALKFLMQIQPQNLKLRDRYVFLQDSLYAQDLKVKTQFAKYKYDDKLKQEDILRLEKENAEQELKAAKQRNQKTLTYAILVPLFLLLGFLTYFFVQRSKRLKQENKTAKLEATYETEAELSRKLHDDFGGKLNHAMLLLQSEANNEEVLNIVDGLYNQSRDFSREINDVDTGPNFKEFLFGMMGAYTKNTKLIVSGSTDIDWLMLSPLSKKTLFKVLQELLINMQKHSNAKLVSFGFEQTKQLLKVTYADDGAGASNEELHLKNGLWNTEKRIKAIGGTIIFDTQKGRGFDVQIRIPN